MTSLSFAQESVRYESVHGIVTYEYNFFIAGDIHIWDRKSAFLHIYIPAPDTKIKDNDISEVISLAGNTKAEQFMFAIGRSNGSIDVWTPTITPQGSSQNDGQPAIDQG